MLACRAGSLSAQYPGELSGRISDVTAGTPIEGAWIQLPDLGRTAISDARGYFRIGGLEPGRVRVRVSRLGYFSRTEEIEIRNGERTRLQLELAPRPIEVEGLRADAGRRVSGDALHISRGELERTGVRTAAEALEGRAGLVVRDQGPDGPRTLSIRGSSADQVLVLLDGAPLNGPVTGETDLSSIPAGQIESITVLKGARSARYGPGAQAGVVLIESRHSVAPVAFRLGTGSLGAQVAEAEAAGRLIGLNWSAGGHFRQVDGVFEFERPEQLGGGIGTRQNADLLERDGFISATGSLAGGLLRARGGFTNLDRGLPGRSFLPSPAAREEMTRWRGSASWERTWADSRLAATVHGLSQTLRFADPDPPSALPYDSRSESRSIGLRLDAELDPGPAGDVVESIHAGLELRDQQYESTEFGRSAPDGRFDFGALAGVELSFTPEPIVPRIVATIRADYDQLADRWWPSHEIALRSAIGALVLHARHASSYSAPTFGDQFFKEGVAVRPNPDLRAERVPSELDLGGSLEGRVGPLDWGLDAQLYLADIRDMIIWAPDFRFIWSPRNSDVERRGLDLQARLALPTQGFRLSGHYGLARVTYDRTADADPIQVIYRPRHTGGLQARWASGPWEIGLGAEYIGTRYPVPARVNALEGFWTLDVRLRRTIRLGRWELVPLLYIDRLLDNEDSLIFGYPEPGRTARLQLAVSAP